ncbi:MAG TPA: BPSL0067 family protein [Synechococcales cyanobacterium M55_K2018_004]|nr:BPSL0067 family protein [Synechococcales cyanobacterium M55_K2018_004]
MAPNYDKLDFIFGTNWNRTVMQGLLESWQQGDFSNLPNIDLLTGVQLKGAYGAFSAETNTIYLSSDFLLNYAGNVSAIANVMLEEIGHAVDNMINSTDTPGDEGDLFQRVIQGVSITADELEVLRTENDMTTLNVNGRTLWVEQSNVHPFAGTSDGVVNIRTGPGTNNAIVGTLHLNQRVTFDAVATGTTHWDARERINDNRWFRIQGTNNWVSAAFITGNPSAIPPSPPPQPPVVSPPRNNIFTGTSDGVVNIRTGPGTNNAIVGTLHLNQRVTFDAVATGTTHWDARERINDNRWFRIQGTNNWVSAAFITGGPGTPPPIAPFPPSSNALMATPDWWSALQRGALTNQFRDVDGYFGAQCWDLVALVTGDRRHAATQWRAGSNVMSSRNIAPGTAIATFKGPNGTYQGHTAIFESYGVRNGVEGFWAWHQNFPTGSGIQRHFIPTNGNRALNNDAREYFIVLR